MEYAKYRMKPVSPQIIEAMQFVVKDDQLPQEVFNAAIELTNGQARVETLADGTEILALHHSGDYWIDVDPGDYILRGDLGRFFVVSQRAFEKVYEPLDAPEKKKRVRRTKEQIAADAAAMEAAK